MRHTRPKVRRKNLSTVKSWRNKVWKVFRQRVILRDFKDKDLVKCYTCHIWVDRIGAEAGHYRHGYYPGTYFMLKNVHIQCVKCNKHMSGNAVAYALALEREYDFGIIQEIDRAKSSNKQIFTIPMLKDEFIKQTKLLEHEMSLRL